MSSDTLYRPPAPVPMSPIRSLLRVIRQGDGDLLSLVPAEAYREKITHLGYSRRSILLVNDPEALRDVLTDPLEIFPKNDLMVGALEPLVGDSLFVSSGATWRRQRAMVEPAFSHMRINRAFTAMCAAVDDYEERFDTLAQRQEVFSLDVAMSQLTADVICRTIFSRSLASQTASDVFHSFMAFERSVANVELKRLIFGKAWQRVRQPDHVLAACERIRRHIGDLLDPRLASDTSEIDDIAAAVIAARDPDSGAGFSREELIDQIGVFFLAGHETTASVLTWALFIGSQQPSVVAQMRAEIDEVVGDDDVAFEHVKQLGFVRSVFRETLRLYPPITFIPRVATRATRIDGVRVRRGAMVMISPWTTHRNERYWQNADRFDPERFIRTRESQEQPNTFLAFGLGPRVCVGAAFATIESGLILARLMRRYDFEPVDPRAVRPVARLTTRPATEIMCRVRRRSD